MAVAKADELGCGSVLISDNEMASRLTHTEMRKLRALPANRRCCDLGHVRENSLLIPSGWILADFERGAEDAHLPEQILSEQSEHR